MYLISCFYLRGCRVRVRRVEATRGGTGSVGRGCAACVAVVGAAHPSTANATSPSRSAATRSPLAVHLLHLIIHLLAPHLLLLLCFTFCSSLPLHYSPSSFLFHLPFLLSVSFTIPYFCFTFYSSLLFHLPLFILVSAVIPELLHLSALTCLTCLEQVSPSVLPVF